MKLFSCEIFTLAAEVEPGRKKQIEIFILGFLNAKLAGFMHKIINVAFSDTPVMVEPGIWNSAVVILQKPKQDYIGLNGGIG